MDLITHKVSSEARFEFVAGNLCLDFANTVGGLRGGLVQEHLTSYLDLVTWSQLAGLIRESETQILAQKAAYFAEEATGVLERASVLRETIYHIFVAITAGTALATSDLDELNRELEKGMAGTRVIVTPDGFGWQWRKDTDALDQMLGPLARSTAILLTSTERKLVRQCASVSCSWLFVDTTKNHRRHWCSTTGCGNKARVQRHRQAKKSTSATQS